MILHSLTDKSCKILQSPSQKVMQDLSGMISPDIVPKSVVILHTKSCKIIEVFNPRSCLCDLTGIILRDLSRLFRHDLSGYSSKIHCDLACKILQDHGSYCFKILQEFFLGSLVCSLLCCSDKVCPAHLPSLHCVCCVFHTHLPLCLRPPSLVSDDPVFVYKLITPHTHELGVM